MEIEDAFATQQVDAAGTNLDETEEARLTAMIREYIQVNEFVATNDQNIVDLCILMFIGGRTYQFNNETAITVEMTLPELRQYSLYLLSRTTSP